MRFIYLVLLTTLFGFGCQQAPKETVDSIYYNAQVFTVDSAFSVVEAIAIKDGKILATGKTGDLLKKYEASNAVDLNQKAVYPGFIDAHCHFVGYAKNQYELNLKNTVSFEDMLDKTVAYAQAQPRSWIIGRGWNEENWESKTTLNNFKLSFLFPNMPVILVRVDGHAALVNQAALEMAGITPETEVDGGEVEVLNGRCTGILIDNAVDLVKDILPEYSNAELRNAFQMAEKKTFEVGLTTLADAGLDLGVAMLIDSMRKEKKLKTNFYIMLNPKKEFLPFMEQGGWDKPGMYVKSIKLYSDGALGSRGALLKKPYCDKDGHHGLSLIEDDTLMFWLDVAYKNDFQINTHCIGDSANARILRAYAQFLEKNNDRRWRIEHAQVVDMQDIPMFKAYQIIPSVQPTHAISDSKMAPKRLCDEHRMEGAYSYQTLLNAAGYLPLGTDFPVENIDPLGTYFSAVYRETPSGSVFRGEEALSHEDALRGMTIWAAKANFMEDYLGSLEPGKMADLVILSKPLNFCRTPAQTKVVYTIKEGEVVYGG
jgi:predicted amidohydrolase YtcJ